MVLESKILSGFLKSEEYLRKVSPFVNLDYFEDESYRIIAQEAIDFFGRYNKSPSLDVLQIEVANRTDITHSTMNALEDAFETIKSDTEPPEVEWLIDETEKYFQKRAVYLAIQDSIAIIGGEDKKRSEDSIPNLLQDALSVTFDMNVGHDYLEDIEDRYEYYHSKDEGILFDIDLLNEITDGAGLRKKTLTAIASRTGGGKSVGMCHISASTLMQGKNVLYITLELAEKRVAERIDANILGMRIGDLRDLTKDMFVSRMEKIREKTMGKLVIKEYPMGSAHAGHFRALIEELKAKKNFRPDLIVVDYLGICASQRIKNNAANTYTIMGSIAEELRSLGQEYDVPVLTGVQVNRQGISNSDMDMTDTSDSMKIVHSLDLYVGFIRTEELDELGQILVKQLKNRYGDPNRYKKFIIGMDASRSKLFNVEASAHKDISDSGHDDAPILPKPAAFKRVNTEFK